MFRLRRPSSTWLAPGSAAVIVPADQVPRFVQAAWLFLMTGTAVLCTGLRESHKGNLGKGCWESLLILGGEEQGC